MNNEEKALSVQTGLAQKKEQPVHPLCVALDEFVNKPLDLLIDMQNDLLSRVKALEDLPKKLEELHESLIELIYIILEEDYE